MKRKSFYKRVEYHRKIGQVALSTLLFLSAVSMAVYPKSYSKYMTDGTVSMGSVTLYPKSQGAPTMQLLGEKDTAPPAGTNYYSSHEEAFIRVSFSRNPVAASMGKEDSYTVSVPSTCKMVYANGGSIRETSNYTLALIRDSNYVIMRCGVQENISNNTLNAFVEVNETIGEEEFTYKKGNFSEPLRTYYGKYPEEVIESKIVMTETYLELPANEVSYTAFLKWLDDYVAKSPSNSPYGEIATNYVKKAYYNEDEETASKDKYAKLLINQSLPGLKFESKVKDGQTVYTYTIVDNFVGYARTDASASQYNMYFSTTDAVVAQDAFEYYLQKIYPSATPDTIHPDAQLILDYVDKVSQSVGIAYLMEKDEAGNLKNKISGLTYNDSLRVVTITEGILSYAYNVVNEIVRIPFNTLSDMVDFYRVGLRSVYSDIISEDLIILSSSLPSASLTIPTNLRGILSLRKNSTNQSPGGATDIVFSDYYIAYDSEKDHYLMIHMYSSGEYYTYVKVTNLTFEKDANGSVAVQLDTSSEALKDVLKATGFEHNAEVLKIVQALDTCFGITKHQQLVDDDNLQVIMEESKVIQVTYTYKDVSADEPLEDEGNLGGNDTPSDVNGPGVIEDEVQDEIISGEEEIKNESVASKEDEVSIKTNAQDVSNTTSDALLTNRIQEKEEAEDKFNGVLEDTQLSSDKSKKEIEDDTSPSISNEKSSDVSPGNLGSPPDGGVQETPSHTSSNTILESMNETINEILPVNTG